MKNKSKLIIISIISLLLYFFIPLFQSNYNVKFETELNKNVKTINSNKTQIEVKHTVKSLQGVDVDNSNKVSTNIPRIIHQSWKDNHSFSSTFHRYIPSWKQCFPNWQYKLWTDKDNREFVKTFYPWFLSKYDSFPKEIYRADVSRYFYMFHFGGIYTDLDNECLKPFENLLINHKLVFGDIDHVPLVTKLKGFNYVQNSFMYSVPNHPIWLELLLEIFHSTSKSTADRVTGPLVLSNMIERYRSKYSSSEEIKIYAAHFFNPITWGSQNKNFPKCKIYNLMSDLEYKECRSYLKNHGSYVAQYHSHVWG